MKYVGKVVLDKTARQWVIDAEPHVVTRLKRIFERIPKHAQQEIPLADSPANCRELLWFCERFPLEVTPREHLEQRAAQHRERETLVEKLLAADYKPADYPLAVPAREYQRLAADICLARGALLCADDMGLGKTVSGICVIADPRARPALVVCPTHQPGHWVRFLQRFAPHLRVHILKKGTPYDLMKGPRGKATPMPDVIISNYHKLAGWAQTLAEIVNSVVYDEAQELRHEWADSGKTRRTARYEAALYLRDRTRYRLGLSGSPVYNYGAEICNVMNALEEDALGNEDEFAREWSGGSSKGIVLDPRALGTHLRREGLMLRRTTKDVGRELPPLSKIVQTIDSDERALKDVSDTVASLARRLLAEGGRGFEKMEAGRELDWRLRQATGVGKAPHVADYVRILVESGQKVLLFGWHRAVYDIWREKLEDLKPVFYTGEETLRQKEAALDAFTKGDAKVLIMSLRAGTGVDGLQYACFHAVFGELDWSPAVMAQDICRLDRDGQVNPVMAHILVSEDGSDPVISDVLGLKRRQADGIINPDADLVEELQVTENRMKLLAKACLERRHEAVGTIEPVVAATPDSKVVEDAPINAEEPRIVADQNGNSAALRPNLPTCASRQVSNEVAMLAEPTIPVATPPDPWAARAAALATKRARPAALPTGDGGPTLRP